MPRSCRRPHCAAGLSSRPLRMWRTTARRAIYAMRSEAIFEHALFALQASNQPLRSLVCCLRGPEDSPEHVTLRFSDARSGKSMLLHMPQHGAAKWLKAARHGPDRGGVTAHEPMHGEPETWESAFRGSANPEPWSCLAMAAQEVLVRRGSKAGAEMHLRAKAYWNSDHPGAKERLSERSISNRLDVKRAKPRTASLHPAPRTQACSSWPRLVGPPRCRAPPRRRPSSKPLLGGGRP